MSNSKQEIGKVEEASNSFIADLRHWREVQGYSQKRLASEMGYDPSYISKIENGQEPPTRGFVESADQVLKTSGILMRRLRELEAAKAQGSTVEKKVTPTPPIPDEASGLVVTHEQAGISLKGGMYTIKVRRYLRNSGKEPVTAYLVRISVDRHPGDAKQSNELYRQNPLTWEEIQLKAECEGEKMSFESKHDKDSFKELWLLFENEHGKFPLYSGQETWIEYSYTVGTDKWGNWLQRAIRLPTERLSVEVSLPVESDPSLWGVVTSMTSKAVPVESRIDEKEEDGQRIYAWSTENPTLHARYRFEWRFKDDDYAKKMKEPLDDRMRRLGICQQGESILEQECKSFDLPDEADEAKDVTDVLLRYLEPIRLAHTFGKGVGLAAPQIGIARSVAIVKLPDKDPLILYNPRIINEFDQTDKQYEGCLSLFNYRGKVTRPLGIEVEHMTLDGQTRITAFKDGDARLWAHEIDHLFGKLFVDYLDSEDDLIPYELYKGTGESWRY